MESGQALISVDPGRQGRNFTHATGNRKRHKDKIAKRINGREQRGLVHSVNDVLEYNPIHTTFQKEDETVNENDFRRNAEALSSAAPSTMELEDADRVPKIATRSSMAYECQRVHGLDCGGPDLPAVLSSRPACQDKAGCPHNRLRLTCKECHGGAICDHGHRKLTPVRTVPSGMEEAGVASASISRTSTAGRNARSAASMAD